VDVNNNTNIDVLVGADTQPVSGQPNTYLVGAGRTVRLPFQGRRLYYQYAAATNPNALAPAAPQTDFFLVPIPTDYSDVPIAGAVSSVTTKLTTVTGTKSGVDYTTASAALVSIDAVNLTFTLVIPVGQKLTCDFQAPYLVNVGASAVLFALIDTVTGIVAADVGFSPAGGGSELTVRGHGVVLGDGVSHTFTLRYSVPGGNTLTVPNQATWAAGSDDTGWASIWFRQETSS